MMMKRDVITISDSGVVTIPSEATAPIRMRDFEIAQLFEIMLPTVRGKIKALLKARMFVECDGGIVSGDRIIPEYFGVEVVVAIALQVDSPKAKIFREYMLRKLTRPTSQPIYIKVRNENNIALN